jgi:ubiquinone/menaquinone biosynthesis C-methylase UbiE
VPKSVSGLSWKGYEGQDYERFWTGPAKQYVDAIERMIVSASLPGGDAIADIGAGFGRFGRCYKDRYAMAHLVEPANNLREIAANTYGHDRFRYHEASVYDLPLPDASVDTALMVRVFHHLDKPDVALREIRRILKPSGTLIFSYSNKRNIKRILRYILVGGESPFTPELQSYYSSLIGHHPRYVESLLSDLGFEVVMRYGIGITDKIVGAAPWLHLQPSLSLARLAGSLQLAPTQFIVARRT